MDYTRGEREMIIGEIIARLNAGEQLIPMSREPHMPNLWTINHWASQDAQFAAELDRAREQGYDQIALDTIAIADGLKPVLLADGTALQSDVQRDKLRVDTRLRVLSKWDPKRYGEAMQMRLADADGEKLDTAPMVRELLALVRPQDGSGAVLVGSGTLVAPDNAKGPQNESGGPE